MRRRPAGVESGRATISTGRPAVLAGSGRIRRKVSIRADAPPRSARRSRRPRDFRRAAASEWWPLIVAVTMAVTIAIATAVTITVTSRRDQRGNSKLAAVRSP